MLESDDIDSNINLPQAFCISHNHSYVKFDSAQPAEQVSLKLVNVVAVASFK